MAADNPSFLASGNIAPSHVVKVSGLFTVAETTASTDKPIGVAQDGTHMAPGVAGDDGLAAVSGGQLRVFQEGEQCLGKVGTGGWTAGDLLKSDTDGTIIVVTFAENNNSWSIGRAYETRSAGELGRMLVHIQVLGE